MKKPFLPKLFLFWKTSYFLPPDIINAKRIAKFRKLKRFLFSSSGLTITILTLSVVSGTIIYVLAAISSQNQKIEIFPTQYQGNWQNPEKALTRELLPESSLEDFNSQNSSTDILLSFSQTTTEEQPSLNQEKEQTQKEQIQQEQQEEEEQQQIQEQQDNSQSESPENQTSFLIRTLKRIKEFFSPSLVIAEQENPSQIITTTTESSSNSDSSLSISSEDTSTSSETISLPVSYTHLTLPTN